MRINYRFFDNFEKQDVLEFKERFNIDISEGCDAFVVYEDDPIFEQVKVRFGENWLDSVSVVDTDFTKKERGGFSIFVNNGNKNVGISSAGRLG